MSVKYMMYLGGGTAGVAVNMLMVAIKYDTNLPNELRSVPLWGYIVLMIACLALVAYGEVKLLKGLEKAER